ncbi:TPA: DNA-directed RNA polymerase subunit E'' [archaeon]|uniref:Transcription elongation factor Spt4 n=1 Tax=Candidatus Naiadarchaeum limnaeum TaxID=2756139 RepID=A0A832UVL5_9ARCH|nr:DNA-directed RNA polymerase subunit E'' [Candidatus Naiadarchaeum limnaeum]
MRKACKKCRFITSESICPVCKSEELSGRFSGVVIIFDPENSEIAKKLTIKQKGEYALIVQ